MPVGAGQDQGMYLTQATRVPRPVEHFVARRFPGNVGKGTCKATTGRVVMNVSCLFLS